MDEGIKLSDRLFNLANAHRVFELACSELETEVKEFFFKGFNFLELFSGGELAELVNLVQGWSPPSLELVAESVWCSSS